MVGSVAAEEEWVEEENVEDQVLTEEEPNIEEEDQDNM